ncbi:MAG: hypothetical protein JXX28_14675 [Deltaproteobacteria bacterium]|nr:hypothetical protein [Deltaproteobacteria bacterium]
MIRRLALGLALAAVSCNKTVEDSGDPSPQPPAWRLGEVLDTEGPAVFAKTTGSWGGDLYLLRLQGTHYEMGYQHGRLVGVELMEMWWTYMAALGAEMNITDPVVVDTILGNLLDQAWEQYGPNTPQIFLDELQGMADGMAAEGLSYGDSEADLVLLPQRLITLMDLAMSSQLDPSDLSGIATFLQSGYTAALLDYYGEAPPALTPRMAEAMDTIRAAKPTGNLMGPGLNCSYYAAWGPRTQDGSMIVTRNMDFAADTGMDKYAMITVFVPDQGVPYASISWLGAATGALAGISAEGITVSAVGASSPLERIKTEPALFRAREVLEFAHNLDEAKPYLYNTVGDGLTRAPTIGYNALLTWGDPRGAGAGAEAIIVEHNGLSIGAYHHHSDCSVDTELVRFDLEGTSTTHTAQTDPELVNTEAEAKEIDALAQIRTFAHDGTDYLRDESGRYIDDPAGVPLQTGRPMDCAVYRGDEAMAYGVRMHQTACGGPADGGDDVMIDGGSYKYRYTPMRLLTEAWETGSALEWKGEELVPAGAPTLIGLDEGELVSRTAAMGSNVWDVVYDATKLKIRVSYESGTGEGWTAASAQPPFMEIDLDDLFLLNDQAAR